MTSEKLIADAILIAYPNAIVGAAEPFKRPAWTGDKTTYASGFYWENVDGDRFYFDTREEAALDLAEDIGMDEEEAAAVLAAGEAVA